MPLLIVITVIIQACFIFHVFKTGRPMYWAFIILSAPVIGSIIYYFVEVFPNSRESRDVARAVNKVTKKMNADRDLQTRLDEAQHVGSIDSRLALARECTERGLHADAARVYESCLEGAYASDAQIMFPLTAALVDSGDLDRARDYCSRLMKDHADYRPGDVKLLRARILEEINETDLSLIEYREAIGQTAGYEARYRYACFLRKLGREEQASTVFEEILASARRNPPSIDTETEWLRLTKRATTSG